MKLLFENWREFVNEQTTILPQNKIGNVIYDPKGLGSVPLQTNVDYMGFTVWMKTWEFLRLNPKRRDGAEFVSQHFQATEDIEIAPPWLGVKYIGDEENPTPNDYWKIYQHEGRGRIGEVEKINPNSLVPVHIFPSGGMRAKHLTRQMVFAPLEADQRAQSSFRLEPTAIIWQGEIYKRSENIDQPKEENV